MAVRPKTVTRRKKRKKDRRQLQSFFLYTQTQLYGRIMKESIVLRPKMYGYLTDDGSVDKKTRGINESVIRWETKFQDYKRYLENNKTKLKSQQRFKSEAHKILTEKVNKIALITNYNKRIQTPDGYVTGPKIVCNWWNTQKLKIENKDFFRWSYKTKQTKIQSRLSTNSWSSIQDTNSRRQEERLHYST